MRCHRCDRAAYQVVDTWWLDADSDENDPTNPEHFQWVRMCRACRDHLPRGDRLAPPCARCLEPVLTPGDDPYGRIDPSIYGPWCSDDCAEQAVQSLRESSY